MTATAIKVQQEIQKPVINRFSPKKRAMLADYELLYKSRLTSNYIRREVLNGKAKFGIESSGKELLQIALGNSFKKGDFYSGYYRDQTFMMKMGLASIQDIFSALYADTVHDKFSGGRQMNGHFATPLTDDQGNWLVSTKQYNVTSAISSLAGHAPCLLYTSPSPRDKRQSRMPSSA